MKTTIIGIFFIMNFFMACSQQDKYYIPALSSRPEDIQIVPFLTKENDFIYVNKLSLKPAFGHTFKTASIYTSTGFAVVTNKADEYAVINDTGKIVLDFSPKEINLNCVNGITFYKREIEYKKKMPVWKWDWNIMGSGIQKKQTYHDIEVGILETGQVLIRKDLPYLEDDVDLNMISIDEKHLFWNGSIYEMNKNRLNKSEQNIADMLNDKRYIKISDGNFSLYNLNQKKAVHSNLEGTEMLSVVYGKETITLTEVNKERYKPEVPKLLEDRKSNNLYAFPLYEKPFPKEITKATASQIDFIRKTSLVYSMEGSPYFLLGVFNYDEAVWAYDWLYIDTNGVVFEQPEMTVHFKVLDQIGNLVWPDRKMIFPDILNTEKWKFGKISSYTGMEDLYIIAVENRKQERNMGLWNSRTQSWDIPPEYHHINVLDTEKQIYALQKNDDGLYRLYHLKDRKMIGEKGYDSVNSEGLVSVKNGSDLIVYYYIDINSGREYREK
ncbi:hypothetical protein VUJ46_01445 [Chryseobacterium sp. MYb264]|uniref:hypothetical protein n=1 Tax=Chryseobacterium sp. MYb264 TaxID=2745153 RepID=UPI002E0EDE97|nr:hypothetical protein VUJ46_01445 [Chryseobacterium sp. MYb264]